ncbi:MAG: TlpA family protein disulfide reductase [bacterium]|nr:TlpA family protein disulfide reductase [bacterium]
MNKVSSRWLVVGFTIVSALVWFTSSKTTTAVAAGAEKFPAFTTTDVDGKTIKSTELLKGKISIVNFWATWCPPCRQEIPHFIELQKKYQGKLQIVGLSADRGADVNAKVKKWATSNGVNYPVAVVTNEFQQPYQNLLSSDEQGGIPYTFILDKQGNIVTRLVGYRDMKYWENEIQKLSK